jgi:hypothetical protein
MVPRTLILGAGAALTSVFVGAVRVIEQLARATQAPLPKHYVGTSGGSILALLLTLGYTSYELEKACFELHDRVGTLLFELDVFFTRFGGIDTHDALAGFLRDCVENKTGQRELTFGQLHQFTDRTLCVSALCLDTSQVVYMGAESHADVSVVDAVCASCAIPLVFTPVTLGGQLFVDAGVVETLAVRDDPDCLMLSVQCKNEDTKLTKLTDFIERVLSAVSTVHLATKLKQIPGQRIVHFTVDAPSSERFPANIFPSREYLKTLIAAGSDQMRAALTN